MKAPLALALTALLALQGCSGFSTSKLNPLNWFKASQEDLPATLYVEPQDGRILVEQVTALTVEPYPGGAIVRATGLPPSQGWWEAELVEVASEEVGVLVLEFRVFPPVSPKPAGSPVSREIVVATDLTDLALAEISKIVVQGQTNARSVSR